MGNRTCPVIRLVGHKPFSSNSMLSWRTPWWTFVHTEFCRYCTTRLKSKVWLELPDVAVIVMTWLPAGVPEEEPPPPFGELPFPPPQAQIANAKIGTKRHRRRVVLDAVIFLKNSKISEAANIVSPVVKTIGTKI